MKKLLKNKIALVAIILGGLAVLLMFIIVVVNMVASLFIISAAGAYLQEQENIASLNLDLDNFTISGSLKDGKYHLVFDFGSWKIKDIVIDEEEGDKALTVKIPSMAGTRREQAYKYLRRNGFTHEAAIGVIVNIMVESAHTYSAIIEENDNANHNIAYRGETVLDKGYGICQWTNTGGDTHGRRYKVIQFLKEKSLDPSKDTTELFFAELEYAIKEYPYITNKVKNVTSAYEAAAIWCREWEIPGGGENSVRERGFMAVDNASSFENIPVYASETATQDARLVFTFKKVNEDMVIEGRLDTQELAGSFNASSSSVSGRGFYGSGAIAFLQGGKLWYQVSGTGTMSPPLPPGKYYVGDGFGYRGDIGVPGASTYHRGVDIFADPDTPILAAADGTVWGAGFDAWGIGGGYQVLIEHEGGTTMYCHMIGEPIVKKGQKVRAGQVIGYVGSTGASGSPHLHFSVAVNGFEWIDPQYALGIKLHAGYNAVWYEVKGK